MNNAAEPNNPAGRILAVLRATNGVTGGTVRGAYTTALGIENNDLGELLSMLGMLSKQCDEVELLLAGINNKTYWEEYRESMPAVKRCFEIESVSVPWDGFRNAIVRPELLATLRFCSITLGEHRGEETVPTEELGKWLSKATKLYEEVQNSDLDPSLKTLILSSLERIRSAIREYKIRGIRAIREAVMDSLGNISPDMQARIRTQISQEAGSDTESPKIVSEYFSLAADIVQIVLFGMAISPIFEPLVRRLLTGH